MQELQKFIDLDFKEQLEVLHKTLKESNWVDGKLNFLLPGVDKTIRMRFLRDVIDTYQGSLNGKDTEYFSHLFFAYSGGFDDEIVYNNLINTVMSVIFLNQWNKVYSEEKKANEEGNYEYIPFRRGRFLSLLNMIMTKIPEKVDFLDVGSGIGDKTILASLHPRIINSWGIELNQHTYELSKFFLHRFLSATQFTPRIFIKFLNMDGLEFERKLVNNKHRILFYSYVPIYEHKKCIKLYERFLTQMKIGDYYWEIASDVRNVDKRKFKFIAPDRTRFGPVWEKINKNTFKEILCD